jgi:hypothetical protein
MQFPFSGYRKVQAELARRGIHSSEYQVRQVLRALGVSRSVGTVRIQTMDSNHSHRRYPNRIRGMELTRPDQMYHLFFIQIRVRSMRHGNIQTGYSHSVSKSACPLKAARRKTASPSGSCGH